MPKSLLAVVAAARSIGRRRVKFAGRRYSPDPAADGNRPLAACFATKYVQPAQLAIRLGLSDLQPHGSYQQKRDSPTMLRFPIHLPCCALLISLIAGQLSYAEVLDSVPQTLGEHRAIAEIEVDTPSGFDFQTNQFVFDGVADQFFTVEGTIRLLHDNPADSFNDPFVGPVGVNGDGLNTVRMEVVELLDFTVTSGSGVTDMVIGDTGADFVQTAGSNQDFFSTGGAAENPPGGTTADGFLALLMEVELDANIPVLNQPVGRLRNQDALILDAQFGDFLPFGIPFVASSTLPHPFFASPGNPLTALVGTDTVIARFTSAQITLVPEPASIVAGILGLGAFLAISLRYRRRIAGA